MKIQLRPLGQRLAIVLPDAILDQLGIGEDTVLDLQITDDRQGVEIRPTPLAPEPDSTERFTRIERRLSPGARRLIGFLEKRLGEAYVHYMERMVIFYEGQSRGVFEREIPQVLLVHANTLNAHYLAPLLERLRARGYLFVDLEEALRDEAYVSADTYVGPGGITWLHRWAITDNMDRSIFAGEPVPSEWLEDIRP